MRPRHKTAENVSRDWYPRLNEIPRFNEAAAQNRGKRRRPARELAELGHRFNEAAAQNRGKHGLVEVLERGFVDASMRPRHKTAENGGRSVKNTLTDLKLQ